MRGSSARQEAINAVKAYEPPAASFAPAEVPGEIFGANVFSKAVMQKRLPEGRLQVRHRHHRTLQAARPHGC